MVSPTKNDVTLNRDPLNQSLLPPSDPPYSPLNQSHRASENRLTPGSGDFSPLPHLPRLSSHNAMRKNVSFPDPLDPRVLHVQAEWRSFSALPYTPLPGPEGNSPTVYDSVGSAGQAPTSFVLPKLARPLYSQPVPVPFSSKEEKQQSPEYHGGQE